MNTSRRQTQPTRHATNALQQQVQHDDMPDPLSVVEHTTIPGFIRRSPHRFHLDEITRFGDKVGKIAESMQISYLTTIDRQLGVIRLFPVPLLTRVYQVMSQQFGWEQIVDGPALEDKKQPEAPRVNERAKKEIRAAAEHADSPEIAQAFHVVLQWIEARTVRPDGPGTVPAPLRAI